MLPICSPDNNKVIMGNNISKVKFQYMIHVLSRICQMFQLHVKYFAVISYQLVYVVVWIKLYVIPSYFDLYVFDVSEIGSVQ